jgi:hypothetical protein
MLIGTFTFTGPPFTIGRPPIGRATTGRVTAPTDQAMAAPIVLAAAPIAPVAALIAGAATAAPIGVAGDIALAEAATAAERIRGEGAERRVSLIVAAPAVAR